MSERERTAGAIAAEIERYLVLHPHAADTAIGIQRAWLSEAWAHIPVERVEEALERLQRQGTVQRLEVRGAEPVYSARLH